jgi:chromosome segregation ATPase
LITQADYYLFGFLGFIVLLLIAILGALYRQGRAIGRLEGQVSAFSQQMREMDERLTARIDDVQSGLTTRIEGVQSSLTARIGAVENGFTDRIDGVQNSLTARIDAVENRLSSRIERLEEQMAALREQVAEIRGLLISLHERVDLLMRHRHDDAGRVVITPEEVAAD